MADQKNQKKKTTQTQKKSQDYSKVVTENTQLELKFAWKKMAPLYQKKLAAQAKNLKIKGFRKGKVPPSRAEQEIGEQAVIEAVLREVLPTAYQEAVDKEKHQPITQPEFQAISLNKDNDWIVKAIFAEKPEISIKNYQKISQKAKKKAELEIAKAQKEMKGQGNTKKSNKTEKSTKKTDDQPPQQTITPQQKEDMLLQAIISALVEELQPVIPEMLLRLRTQQEFAEFVERLKKLNLELDKYLQSQQLTKEQLYSQLALSSLSRLQVEFLLQAISETEKIEATNSEIDQWLEKTGDGAVSDTMKQNQQYRGYIKHSIQQQKVIKHLLSI